MVTTIFFFKFLGFVQDFTELIQRLNKYKENEVSQSEVKVDYSYFNVHELFKAYIFNIFPDTFT